RAEIHEAERLEVRDLPGPHRRPLRRGEAKEELSAAGDQPRARDAGSDRHLPRQRVALAARSAYEAAPPARHVQQAARLEPSERVVDMQTDVAAEQDGKVVSFERRGMRIARESPRLQQR